MNSLGKDGNGPVLSMKECVERLLEVVQGDDKMLGMNRELVRMCRRSLDVEEENIVPSASVLETMAEYAAKTADYSEKMRDYSLYCLAVARGLIPKPSGEITRPVTQQQQEQEEQFPVRVKRKQTEQESQVHRKQQKVDALFETQREIDSLFSSPASGTESTSQPAPVLDQDIESLFEIGGGSSKTSQTNNGVETRATRREKMSNSLESQEKPFCAVCSAFTHRTKSCPLTLLKSKSKH